MLKNKLICSLYFCQVVKVVLCPVFLERLFSFDLQL